MIWQQLAAAAGETGSSSSDGWFPIAASVTAAAALGGVAVNKLADRRDRRRTLYAEAYKAALAWVEALYRVRRRDPDRPYELAAQFHELQEAIDFHQGWIDAESVELGRAYRRLVMSIKALTFHEIKEAWKQPPCDPAQGFSLEEHTHPKVADAKEQFVRDVRDHLSMNPNKRMDLKDRYEDANWQRMLNSLPKPERRSEGEANETA